MYKGDCFNFFSWGNHVHTGEKQGKSLTKQNQKLLTSNTEKEEPDICKKQLIPQPQGRTETLSKSWLDVAAYSHQWHEEIQNRRKSVILLLWLQPVYGAEFLRRAPSPTENKRLSQAWQLMRRLVPNWHNNNNDVRKNSQHVLTLLKCYQWRIGDISKSM